ncbi:MAG: M48 family peptidase [Parcubacteria group bacterium Gr01-1014_8]|nr:MAG: M48 family peptidase [Parcubacteria group bacterium Gr01-1014_8]
MYIKKEGAAILMSILKKIVLLLVISAIVESASFAAYHYFATGPLKEAFLSHEKDLRDNVLPPVESIDLENGEWTKVARFESAFYEVSLVVGILFSFFIAWLIIFGGVSSALANLAKRLYRNVHAQRSYYLLGMVLLSTFIALPTYVSDYYIELLRGTSNITPLLAVEDLVLNLFLEFVFAIATFIPLYWIMDKYPRAWWALGAAFLTLFSIFTGYIAPVVIDPLFSRNVPLEDSVLKEKIITLADSAGISVDRVFVEDASTRTLESNAYMTGLWSTKRVVLDDTLLTYYTDDEILAILGHELGHYVKHDMWRGIVQYAIETFISLGLLALILWYVLKKWGKRIGSTRVNDIVLYPFLGVILSTMSLLAAPIDSAISRDIEHKADVFGFELTHATKPAITSFRKMTYQSFVDPDPPRFLQWWFGTHPTMKERIEFLENATF